MLYPNSNELINKVIEIVAKYRYQRKCLLKDFIQMIKFSNVMYVNCIALPI